MHLCTLPQTRTIAVPRFRAAQRWSRPPRDAVVRWLLDCARLSRRLGLPQARREYIEQAVLVRCGCSLTRRLVQASMADAMRAATEDQAYKWEMDRE